MRRLEGTQASPTAPSFNGATNTITIPSTTGIDYTIDGDVVTISDKEGVQHHLPFEAIDTAKLVLTDKLIAATVPLSAEGADEMEEEGQD